MQLKLSLRSCASFERGFTIIELLVSMTLGLIVVGLGISSILTSRYVLSKELTRTRLAQNLRGTLDIVGADLRIAGENLGRSFPAVEIVDGAAGAPDELVVRRNLIDEVLPLCTAIVGGSATSSLVFAGTAAPGCVYSGQTHNYSAWSAYRAAHSGAVDAFIYDTSTKLGEFFEYISENDTGAIYSINRTVGTWANSYNTASSAIYILEEWRYQLSGELLQLIQNGDSANPLNVSFGLQNFQASVILVDGSSQDAFARTDDWTQISQVIVQLSGQERYAGRNLEKTISGRFFPRNVLSN